MLWKSKQLSIFSWWERHYELLLENSQNNVRVDFLEHWILSNDFESSNPGELNFRSTNSKWYFQPLRQIITKIIT